MKIILNLKWLSIAIFMLNLQSAIINLHSSNLYAQDPQLFDHTWYFEYGELNGEPFMLPSIPEGFYSTINFIEESANIYALTTNYSHCEAVCGAGILFFINEPLFEIIDTACFASSCPLDSEMYIFESMNNLFYGMLSDVPNPFTYNLEPVNDNLQLTIENGEGDWAVYNSVLLSTPTFHQNSFTMYPNPVQENLTIKNISNQAVTATLYDVSGKLLQSHELEENTSTINVKTLNTGLYFVVFENESGERVSKKFVKN